MGIHNRSPSPGLQNRPGLPHWPIASLGSTSSLREFKLVLVGSRGVTQGFPDTILSERDPNAQGPYIGPAHACDPQIVRQKPTCPCVCANDQVQYPAQRPFSIVGSSLRPVTPLTSYHLDTSICTTPFIHNIITAYGLQKPVLSLASTTNRYEGWDLNLKDCEGNKNPVGNLPTFQRSLLHVWIETFFGGVIV